MIIHQICWIPLFKQIVFSHQNTSNLHQTPDRTLDTSGKTIGTRTHFLSSLDKICHVILHISFTASSLQFNISWSAENWLWLPTERLDKSPAKNWCNWVKQKTGLRPPIYFSSCNFIRLIFLFSRLEASTQLSLAGFSAHGCTWKQERSQLAQQHRRNCSQSDVSVSKNQFYSHSSKMNLVKTLSTGPHNKRRLNTQCSSLMFEISRTNKPVFANHEQDDRSHRACVQCGSPRDVSVVTHARIKSSGLSWFQIMIDPHFHT